MQTAMRHVTGCRYESIVRANGEAAAKAEAAARRAEAAGGEGARGADTVMHSPSPPWRIACVLFDTLSPVQFFACLVGVCLAVYVVLWLDRT